MKNKENKIKNKTEGKKIFGKLMAAFLLAAMILASCSTFIYYVVATVK